MIKSAIYFHGLESSQGGIKVQFLDQEVDFLEAPARRPCLLEASENDALLCRVPRKGTVDGR